MFPPGTRVGRWHLGHLTVDDEMSFARRDARQPVIIIDGCIIEYVHGMDSSQSAQGATSQVQSQV